MSLISSKRCLNHSLREAAARCTGCGEFFCRECASEHEGKLVCSRCLLALSSVSRKKDRDLIRAAGSFIWAASGFCLCWITLYYLGAWLFALPDTFHDGSLWEKLLQ